MHCGTTTLQQEYPKSIRVSSPRVSVFRLFALFNNCNDDHLAKLAEYVRLLMSSLIVVFWADCCDIFVSSI